MTNTEPTRGAIEAILADYITTYHQASSNDSFSQLMNNDKRAVDAIMSLLERQDRDVNRFEELKLESELLTELIDKFNELVTYLAMNRGKL